MESSTPAPRSPTTQVLEGAPCFSRGSWTGTDRAQSLEGAPCFSRGKLDFSPAEKAHALNSGFSRGPCPSILHQHSHPNSAAWLSGRRCGPVFDLVVESPHRIPCATIARNASRRSCRFFVGALLAAPATADLGPSPRAKPSALRLFSRVWALRPPPYFHYRLERTSAVCFVAVTAIFNHF